LNVSVPTYLRLVETAGTIAFVDIEGTGLKGDYNSILVASVKPYCGKVTTFVVEKPGNDKRLVKDLRDHMSQFDCWVGYYSSGYDLPMINTRLWQAKQDPLPSRHHIDLYFKLKNRLLLARRSQAHLLRLLEGQEQKMDMSAEDWNRVIADPDKMIPKMKQRCESDVAGLETVYEATKHLIGDIARTSGPEVLNG
jgi:uncharacterized protein YprB with RNaseH-like and TPR domain